MADSLSRIQKHTAKLYDLLAASETKLQSKAVMRFAEKNALIYFKTVKAHDFSIPVIRGMTSALHQRDTDLCIGNHDGYDMVYVNRQTALSGSDGVSSEHRWHVMEFDLKQSVDLPLIIIGSANLSKAMYSKLFSENRQLRHMPLGHTGADAFHAHYTVLAAPANITLIHQILTDPIITKIAHHKEPFTIEIHQDSLYVITDSPKTSETLLTKMMHYGIWLARHIDSLQK